MATGLIFGVQHFSVRDGTGIRSVVFLKGCPLRCLWCHNPEGLSRELGIQWHERDCVRCGLCGNVWQDMASAERLSEERKRELVRACPKGALRLVGKRVEPSEIVEEVVKDLRYFRRSGGGLTISGGEPMYQPEFAIELARCASEAGISVAMETSGFAARGEYERVAPYIDEFLWDYKGTGAKQHKQLTGVSDKRILENFEVLYERGAVMVLRCPLIPEVNDGDDCLRGIAKFVRQHPRLSRIEIMPYHKMGVSKSRRVGVIQQEFSVPSKELKAHWKREIEVLGGREVRLN